MNPYILKLRKPTVVRRLYVNTWQGLESGNITFSDELDFDIEEVREILDG